LLFEAMLQWMNIEVRKRGSRVLCLCWSWDCHVYCADWQYHWVLGDKAFQWSWGLLWNNVSQRLLQTTSTLNTPLAKSSRVWLMGKQESLALVAWI
jgi:hypothetical protein